MILLHYYDINNRGTRHNVKAINLINMSWLIPLKASLISSSESVSFIFLAIMVKNSGKSMVPLPVKPAYSYI